MSDFCGSAIKACAVRLTRLDDCGRPVVGPKSVITSRGFISVTASADVEAGNEFLVKNACGDLCINERDCDILKRYNVKVLFCKIDPGAVELTTSQRLLTDPTTGDAKGFALGNAIQCDSGWSLELWQKLAGDQCTTGGPQPWLYWAFPWLSNGQLGDLTFENGPFQFEVNAQTKAVNTNSWGTDNRGPECVLPAGAGLLEGEHVASFVTDVQPPDDVCGLQAYAAQVCV